MDSSRSENKMENVSEVDLGQTPKRPRAEEKKEGENRRLFLLIHTKTIQNNK